MSIAESAAKSHEKFSEKRELASLSKERAHLKRRKLGAGDTSYDQARSSLSSASVGYVELDPAGAFQGMIENADKIGAGEVESKAQPGKESKEERESMGMQARATDSKKRVSRKRTLEQFVRTNAVRDEEVQVSFAAKNKENEAPNRAVAPDSSTIRQLAGWG